MNLKTGEQENKTRQIFRKTNISYTLILTRTCAYQVVLNFRFSENLTHFVFLLLPFWDSPFCLVTDELYIIEGSCIVFRLLTPQMITFCKQKRKLLFTTQKMKFSIKDFFSKCDQIRRKLWIWSHLPKKSLMENFIFCAVTYYKICMLLILYW